MPLTRTPHWATRELPEFIASRQAKPFAWGSNDCCLIAADEIQAITGTDIAGDFRGKYTDQASAFALIKSITGGSKVADAAAFCAAQHGLVEWKYPLQAQRGDLVVVQDGDQLIAGFVHPNGRFATSIGLMGMKLLPIAQVRRAWHV